MAAKITRGIRIGAGLSELVEQYRRERELSSWTYALLLLVRRGLKSEGINVSEVQDDAT